MKKFTAIITVSILLTGMVFAKSAEKSKVQKIRVAHTNYYVPYDFVDENGNSDGFEVAVLKEIDKLLPEYEFEYTPTSDDDLLVGVLQGKYDVGTKGIWITEERQKKYLFPKNPIGASVIGITLRTEETDKVKDINTFAKYYGKLVPISPNNAQYAVIDGYNKENPGNQVKLVAGDQFNVTDAYVWVLEGRYDGYIDIKLSYQNNILKDGAPYAKYKDKLTYITYKGIPTWPIFNKKHQKFAGAYDEAYTKLKNDGTISRLAVKYFGEDISVLLK